MALIVCRECGKKYSDSLAACIHCGAPRETVLEKTEGEFSQAEAVQEIKCPKEVETVVQEKQAAKSINFTDMPEFEQTPLENEFLSQDKVAYQYQRRLGDSFSLLGMSIGCCFLPLVYVILLRFLFHLVKNESMVTAAVIVCGVIMGIGVVGLIGCIVWRIFLTGKFKKIVYEKRLSRWLKEKKGIEYTPHFTKPQYEALFMAVDPDKERL